MLLVAVPAAVLGARLSGRLPVTVLTAAFGLFVLGLAARLVWRSGGGSPSRRGDLLAAAAGGFGVGTISVGLGALTLPRQMARRPERAVGTSLAAVFGASLVAAVARIDGRMLDELAAARGEILELLTFAVPAVLVGGQLGPRLARRLPRLAMRRYAAAVLALAGGLMLLRVWGPGWPASSRAPSARAAWWRPASWGRG